MHLFCRQQFPVRIKWRNIKERKLITVDWKQGTLHQEDINVSSSKDRQSRIIMWRTFEVEQLILQTLKMCTVHAHQPFWLLKSYKVVKTVLAVSELQVCVTRFGWHGDTAALWNSHFCVCLMWHVEDPTPEAKAFFYLSFYVTSVQLCLWGKPSLSCQSSWCALSQTIYWCWV